MDNSDTGRLSVNNSPPTSGIDTVSASSIDAQLDGLPDEYDGTSTWCDYNLVLSVDAKDVFKQKMEAREASFWLYAPCSFDFNPSSNLEVKIIGSHEMHDQHPGKMILVGRWSGKGSEVLGQVRLVLESEYDIQAKLNLCLKLDLHPPSSSLYEAQLTRIRSVCSRPHEELLLLALATLENIAFADPFFPVTWLALLGIIHGMHALSALLQTPSFTESVAQREIKRTTPPVNRINTLFKDLVLSVS
ncbi:hypothetical protein HWV62_11796 [Athelia sp. TMB]|nr:hypothetical protein HWV62_11796 [Athelia sp. TMB]